MKTDELREIYQSFFESKGCVRCRSDVLVPRDDPTVLFTPAGMNQFKNQFLGIGELEFTRATTCQKCMRTGDTNNVGVTSYHHTFFEMLGNFSFGDYFKREAILWAWEFLTDASWLGLDPDRLSATVYLDDEEAYGIWRDEVKLPAARISREDEHENFWPAGAPSQGPDGVCGPCSEIFYRPPGSHDQVEVWNLVFTQFNRVGDPPDNLRPLPKKNIDTGMGLERTAAALQGVQSSFEIDILKPLCLAAGEVLGVSYKFDGPAGRAVRRIADHIRAVTFCIHEGVAPGSEKESYVVRQLLRRALLEGYLLGKQEPFLSLLVPAVVEVMRVPYPDLTQTIESVSTTIEEEESQFLGVIEKGLAKFEQSTEKIRGQGGSVFSGEDAFDLNQTDGFLIELTEAMAAKKNLSVDIACFNSLMQQHKQGSGSGAFLDAVMAEGPLDALRKTSGGTEFLGYESEQAEAAIVGIIAEKQLVDELTEIGHASPVAVVLDQTPFYGEAGGQVGDTGTLSGEECEFTVIDTQRQGTMLVHIGHLKRGRLEIGRHVTARIDTNRRAGIRRAHSATHLLHHALRGVLGEQAMQRGSKVEDDSLRFDFAHRKALTSGELSEVEDRINARIAEGAHVSTQLMDLEEARQLGATALFGEKYPDRVRVVRMGDFSIELCGGTHLSSSGQVGTFKVTTEEPVAKGVRRITAVTGRMALDKIRETEELLGELVRLLKVPRPEDLPRRVAVLQDELRQAKQELAEQSSRSVAGLVDDLIASAEDVGGVKIVANAPPDCDREMLRDFSDQLRVKASPVAIVLGAIEDSRVALTAAVSRDLVERGLSAAECIKVAAKVVGGGGGGRPDLAEAGGKIPEKLPQALEAGAAYYRDKLQA